MKYDAPTENTDVFGEPAIDERFAVRATNIGKIFSEKTGDVTALADVQLEGLAG